jgi:hypothetical protein
MPAMIPVPAHSAEEAKELAQKLHGDKPGFEVVEVYDERETPDQGDFIDNEETEPKKVIN